jgi:PAS domain S-box-containing protein
VTDFSYTSVFDLSFTLMYAQVVVGVAILIRLILREHRLYRLQAGTMLVGILVPIAANLLWWSGNSPVAHLDFSPFALTVTGVMFLVGLSLFGLLDISPVTRHALVARMRDGVIVLDDRNRIIDSNPAAERILGADDIVGRQVESVFPRYHTAVEAGADEERERDDYVTTIDGETRHFEVRVSPVTDGRARVETLLILQDITGRRRAEARHRRLVEESSDLVIVFDTDGTIEYISPSTEQVLGYHPDEVVGENVLAFTHPADTAELRSRVETDLAEPGGTTTMEHRVRRADGSWCIVESKARNLTDDTVVGGLVVNSRDVTIRKERERELEAQNERLERFTSVVSHDLRNPLGVAQGYLELGRETGDESAFDETADSLDRMGRMIDDLLTLARDGRTIDDPRPIDVGRVAHDAWASVSHDDATLSVEVQGTTEADEQRLRDLFENLFRNAVEHGDSRVHVTVGETANGFFVADDGPGIPPDIHEAVFEFGYTTNKNGTGFGLNIVKRIAEAHGWSVTLGESDSGGAMFEFTYRETISDSGTSRRPESA